MASRRGGEPTSGTARKLMALSGNRCAWQGPDGRGCEEVLARPEWPRTAAKFAHIYGENEGSARWDASKTDDQLRSYGNIIVMCANHHDLIDYLEPDNYPPDVLFAMKDRHEGRANPAWASDMEIERYADLVIEVQFHSTDALTLANENALVVADETDPAASRPIVSRPSGGYGMSTLGGNSYGGSFPVKYPAGRIIEEPPADP